MAEILLDEKGRKVLAELLRHRKCPPGIPPDLFKKFQRGEFSYISIEVLDWFCQEYGPGLLLILIDGVDVKFCSILQRN
jgi:hypothetical protein